MIEHEAEALLRQAGPLLILAVVILVGVTFGGAARRIGLPSITGQILAGALIGRAGLDWFSHESIAGLQPLTHFALGLIAVTVGTHLNVRRLRNAGRRLFNLLITEATLSPLIVFLAVWQIGRTSVELAALFAAVSIATAPATIVAIVKEARAKGVFVKTLLAAVALNNMACIVLFEVVRALVSAGVGSEPAYSVDLGEPIGNLLMAAGIGTGTAIIMDVAARFAMRPDRMATAAVVALVFASGVADALGVSPMLACLFLGLVQTNLTQTRSHLVDSVFADFEPAILTVFFTLAGMHLSLDQVGLAGLVALVLFGSRMVGKMAAADVAMRLAGATDRVRKNLGLALMPQAGIAVGLVLIVQEDPRLADISGFFGAVVLTVVTVAEVIGPILTRTALRRTGEVGMDRLRLIDFLQEENIVTEFRAESKEEAIEKLVDLMASSHDLMGLDRGALLQSVMEREAEGSTCLGGGLAVPHGILPEGQAMVGVMALSRRGLDFETPDDRAIHCMVLLGTAPDERNRHLQVLAVLARTIGIDPNFQDQLFNAESPAHAYEILHGEESEDFNYFLEDPG